MVPPGPLFSENKMLEQLRSLLLCAGLAMAAAPAAALQAGDPAPDFSLPGSDGKTYRLENYRDRQAVVLAWFPKAHTSGCTIECKSLAENGSLIRKFDVAYFMASVDPLEKNQEFAADTGADFPLLSDEDKSVAKAYSVLGMLGLAKRHTIYIGKDGRILKIDKDIRPETSAEDMIANMQKLGIAQRGTASP
jgi:peroxiredoxin Q/BCP